MRINEVKKKTGLTKKAIDYYEERGLIKTNRSDNGYREYNEDHIQRLKEISMLRKLDFSINEIKDIIRSSDRRNKLKLINDKILDKEALLLKVKRQEKYLHSLMSSDYTYEKIDEISNKIDFEEKKNGEYIKNTLLRVFPEMLGDFMVVHFGRYLNEPIDTKEKEIAWLEIVDFLDNIEDFNIPKEFLEAFKDGNDFNAISEIDEKAQQTMKAAIKGDQNAIGGIKKNVEDYMNMRDKPELKEVFDKMAEYKKSLSKFYENSGYYSVFIPNLKIISKTYNDYHEGLIRLNEKLTKELKIGYDDNMNIVRIDED
ncbi:MerR family transcriptional regulator [Oceanirhabdus sp. W0125-5]|uniref:MerR family transcriptional regulator n=1 Tax=Oceanirhabdus sp. W0125-5 TaxID=2999116 RepID=UPI0022F2C91B|nr:MerR family transcriptional regulator [Oceanirhabdus sp. W0125-5]WBW97811.1 MerR family transcriptional regulator [Oceanirhabdus sp. W0125-5]